MSPEEYRKATLAISATRENNLTPVEAQWSLYGLGLSGEAGEVTDEIKKHVFHGKGLDTAALIKEVGDVLWYADRILMMVGATIEDAMQANVDKLRARYPEGWDAAERHYDWEGAAA